MAAEINAKGSTIEVGVVRPLFATQAATSADNYDVSGDGKRFLINSLVEGGLPLTLVVNWMAELKKK